MDIDSDEYELKRLLVSLEDRQKHLLASVEHLKNAVKSRDLEVRELLSQRELAILKQNSNKKSTFLASEPVYANKSETTKVASSDPQDSDFTRKVDEILARIVEKSEQVSSLVTL